MPKRSEEFVFPQPDAEGIKEMQAFYKKEFQRDLTDVEAYEVVSRLMRYLYLVNHGTFLPASSEGAEITDSISSPQL